MRIVAIAALHQALIDAMVERAVELLLGLEVASIAKLRLLFLHQPHRVLGVVRRVTVDTTYVVLEMCRARVITVLFAVGVAPEAAAADIFCGRILESENL